MRKKVKRKEMINHRQKAWGIRFLSTMMKKEMVVGKQMQMRVMKQKKRVEKKLRPKLDVEIKYFRFVKMKN